MCACIAVIYVYCIVCIHIDIVVYIVLYGDPRTSDFNGRHTYMCVTTVTIHSNLFYGNSTVYVSPMSPR